MPRSRQNPRAIQQLQRTGYIVFSDIKNFSITGSHRQVELVSSMWEQLRKQPLMRKHLDPAVNVTGDGVVVAFAEHRGKPSANQIFEFACAWDKAVKKAGISMRIAIHYGTYFVPTIQGFPPRLALGSAVNECARILGFSEPGAMAVSEAYLEHWHSTESQTLEPHKTNLSRYPISVWVKHDRPMSIRVHVSHPSARIPRKFSDIEFVAKSLRALLGDIESSFLAFLTTYHAAFTPKVVGSRITILAPFRADEHKAVLRSSQFRVARERDTKPGDQSQVHYEFDRPGMGPPGRAFHTGEPQVLHRLPDYKKDKEAYLAQLHRADVPSDMVEIFSCHSRAFIEIPFGLSLDRPEGVVCIDTLNPLTALKVSDLRKFAETTSENYGLDLALLWRARIQ